MVNSLWKLSVVDIEATPSVLMLTLFLHLWHMSLTTVLSDDHDNFCWKCTSSHSYTTESAYQCQFLVELNLSFNRLYGESKFR